MDQYDRVISYFNEKERKKLEEKRKESGSVYPDMTEEEIRLSCLENNGYESPELNDKLYLHFKGFRKIENLDKYVGCKAIWLDSNGFTTIEGLTNLVNLRCLYLSKNLISSISGLETLTNLSILDLSYNRLTKITGLSTLTSLETLNVSYNYLTDADSIDELKNCLALKSLDLSNNRLLAEDDVLEALIAAGPNVTSLNVNGNPVARIANFRKRMLSGKKTLGYLDRPVAGGERETAEGWATGGPEGEAAAREAYRLKEKEREEKEREAHKLWLQEQKELREKKKSEEASRPMARIEIIEGLENDDVPSQANNAISQSQGLAKNLAGLTEEERELLNAAGGIEAVAKLYWKIEANPPTNKENTYRLSYRQYDDHLDPLEIAIAQLIEGERNKRKMKALEEEEKEKKNTEENLPTPPPTTSSTEETDKILPPPAPEETLPNVSFNNEEELAQAARDFLVHESFEIYKKQVEGKDTIVKPTPQNTWEANKDSNIPVYWTEEMDLLLAKYVKEFAYDFDAISEKLNEQKFNNKLYKFTNDLCRERWSELDATKWSIPQPGTDATHTIFRVNVQDEIFNATDSSPSTNSTSSSPIGSELLLNGQKTGVMSYDKLANLVSTMKPKYLKPPTVLPSVADYDSDDSDDSEVEVPKNDKKLEEFKKKIEVTSDYDDQISNLD